MLPFNKSIKQRLLVSYPVFSMLHLIVNRIFKLISTNSNNNNHFVESLLGGIRYSSGIGTEPYPVLNTQIRLNHLMIATQTTQSFR